MLHIIKFRIKATVTVPLLFMAVLVSTHIDHFIGYIGLFFCRPEV